MKTTDVVDAHYTPLIEAILISSHNIDFLCELCSSS